MFKKLCLALAVIAMLGAGSALAEDKYATTDMTWAEFYAGEIGVKSSDLAVSYDAVSTATQRFVSRFSGGFLAATSGDGSVFSGVKAVQVRISEDVYNALADKSRYTESSSAFTEYKVLSSDGSFGKMFTTSVDANSALSGLSVSLSGGPSNHHGNYTIAISGLTWASLDVSVGTSYDKFLGATLETSDGTVYGLKPLHNLWVRGDLAQQGGFSVQEFTEGNGTKLSYAHTADLPGKTIKKITYMLKNQPDVVISCDLFVKSWTDASAKVSGDVKSGSNVKAAIVFSDLPSGAAYTLSSLEKITGHHQSTALTAGTDYSYSDGVITFTDVDAGNYSATFTDETYADLVASFSISDYYATTNMSWAEFYAGETGQTSSELSSAGLDAISTPTTSKFKRFPLLWGAVSPDVDGTVISGEKAVQVRMTGQVYAALSDKSRYTLSSDTFSEYKQVSADGTFGPMISDTTLVSTDATVTLATGASSTWGHYTITVSGVSLDIGLSDDKIARKYLGVLLETKSGDIFGMRHNNNIYSDADTIAFCVSDDYVEPHGLGIQRSWEYTKSLAGQTITKITYMLKDIPDVVISCEVYIPSLSTASVSVSADKLTAGSNLSIPLTFSGLPDGVTYTVTSVYSGRGRTRTTFSDYTFTNNVLTINGEVPAGDYTAILQAEGYTDIAAKFTVEERYYYAETDMTWAEFYAGETRSSSADLWAAGLDAVSSPTARVAGRFTQLVSTSNDLGGRDITGVKAVHVAMTEEVYALLSSDSRYTWSDDAFSEYKLVSADGSFGEMLTEYEYADGAVVTLRSGAGATWGNYMLNVSSIDVTLGSGDTRYYLGMLITTSSGDVYGLRHNSNLWFNANDIALSYKEFVEPHGISRDYDYTSDLEGKTITKIQYMLKDRPDVIVSCDVYLKLQTTATVSCDYGTGKHGILAGSGAPITIIFSSDVSYDIASVTPSIRHAAALDSSLYTFSGDVLTLDASLSAGNYRAIFENEKYSDLSLTLTIFTTNVTGDIVSPDNNGASLMFLLTPRGYSDSTDAVLDANKFVNATDYTTISANKTADYSAGISGTGFSFDIVLNGVSSDYTGIVGFSKVVNMTSSTLGSTLYNRIYTVFNALPKVYEEWRVPSSADFALAGLRIVLLQADGITRDLTGLAGGGVIISSDGSIMLNYGAMAADCAQSEITEGSYLLSDEGETLIADGVRDDHIRVAMYIEDLYPYAPRNSADGDPSDTNSVTDNTSNNSEGDNSEGDNTSDNNSGGDNSGDNNSGGDNSGGGDNANNDSPSPSSPNAPGFSMSDTAVLARIRNLLQSMFSFITGNVEVAQLPDDAMGGTREASPEELAALPSGQVPVMVLPVIVVPRTAIYVFGVSLAETGLSVGAPISLMMNAGTDTEVSASAESRTCVFVDDEGNEIDTVPSSMSVNVAAYMEADTEYKGIITTTDETSGGEDTDTSNDDVNRSSGGCNAGLSLIALAVIALKKK